MLPDYFLLSYGASKQKNFHHFETVKLFQFQSSIIITNDTAFCTFPNIFISYRWKWFFSWFKRLSNKCKQNILFISFIHTYFTAFLLYCKDRIRSRFHYFLQIFRSDFIHYDDRLQYFQLENYPKDSYNAQWFIFLVFIRSNFSWNSLSFGSVVILLNNHVLWNLFRST